MREKRESLRKMEIKEAREREWGGGVGAAEIVPYAYSAPGLLLRH